LALPKCIAEQQKLVAGIKAFALFSHAVAMSVMLPVITVFEWRDKQQDSATTRSDSFLKQIQIQPQHQHHRTHTTPAAAKSTNIYMTL